MNSVADLRYEAVEGQQTSAGELKCQMPNPALPPWGLCYQRGFGFDRQRCWREHPAMTMTIRDVTSKPI